MADISSRLSMIRVNHRNSIDSFTDNTLISFKDDFYAYLSELDEIDNKIPYKYLEKTYLRLIFQDAQAPSDFIVLCTKISKYILKNRPYSILPENKIQKVLDHFNYAETTTIKDNLLLLDINTVNDIASIIVRNFSKFEDYRIFKKEEFYKRLLLNKEEEFLNEEYNCFPSFHKSFQISPLQINNDFKTTCSSFVSNVSGTAKSLATVVRKKESYRRLLKECFPKQLKELFRIFQIVKKIIFVIPRNSEMIEMNNYILVLANLQWLFPSILELYIDLECNLYKYSISFYSKNKIIKNNCSQPLYKIIAENKCEYELLMFIPYFASLLSNINNFQINIPESYNTELNFLFKNEKIEFTNYHLLDNFDLQVCLTKLELRFNALDSNTFRRVISLIHKNNNLKELSLNLFPVEMSDDYFTSNNIFKMTSMPIEKCEHHFSLNKALTKTLLKDTIIDETEYLLNILADHFEKNLEFLCYILNQKAHNLSTIKIIFDLPSILFVNDKYLNSLHKFILNLLNLVNTQDENYNSNIQNIELNSHNFNFDARKFPNLNRYFFEQIGKGINKNMRILNFGMNLRFYKITSLNLLIPKKDVEFLNLGEFDPDSFKSFLDLFKLKKSFENLINLKISVNNLIFQNHRENFQMIYELFNTSKKKKNLKNLTFSALIPFQEGQIMDIFDTFESGSIENYTINLSKKHFKQNHMELFKKDYFGVIKNFRIFAVIYCLKSKYHINKDQVLKNIDALMQKKINKRVNVNFL
jgi:hypothetical protein